MQCPFCKEEIKDGAIKCKHCESMLKDDSRIVSETRPVIEHFLPTTNPPEPTPLTSHPSEPERPREAQQHRSKRIFWFITVSSVIILAIVIVLAIIFPAHTIKNAEKVETQKMQQQTNRETQPDSAKRKVRTIRYGELKIVDTDPNNIMVLFNNRRIYGENYGFIFFEEYFQLGSSDVVLLAHSPGGNATPDVTYQFITVRPDGFYSISNQFVLEGEYRASRNDDSITIKEQLDYGEGAVVVYKEDKVQVTNRVIPTTGPAPDRYCKGLYELYKTRDVCDIESLSRAQASIYYGYTEDKRINKAEYDRLSVLICKKVKEPIDYAKFKDNVCISTK